MLNEKPMERVDRIEREAVEFVMKAWKYSKESAEMVADAKVGYYEEAILENPEFKVEYMFDKDMMFADGWK